MATRKEICSWWSALAWTRMGCVPPPIGRLLIAWIFWGLGSGDIKAGYSIVIYEITAALVCRRYCPTRWSGLLQKTQWWSWSCLSLSSSQSLVHPSCMDSGGSSTCWEPPISRRGCRLCSRWYRWIERSIKESRDRGSSPHVILRAYSATRREPWAMVNSSSPTSFLTGEWSKSCWNSSINHSQTQSLVRPEISSKVMHHFQPDRD